jgi:hypothetical protein
VVEGLNRFPSGPSFPRTASRRGRAAPLCFPVQAREGITPRPACEIMLGRRSPIAISVYFSPESMSGEQF